LVIVRRVPVSSRSVPKLVSLGYAGMAAGAVASAAAVHADSIALLLVASPLFGAGGAAMALLLRTIAATLDAPDRRARAIALVAGGGGLGGAVAPARV
jgi:MFS family permease